MPKKPPAPVPPPAPEPKKRPTRKAQPPAPTPKPKRKAKTAPAKKPVRQKRTPEKDPSAITKLALAAVSAKAGKTVRKAQPKAVETVPVAVNEDAPTDDAGELFGCSPRMSRFVDLYLLLNFNATRAYMEAGYQVKSAEVAGTVAARLLGTARVRQLLAHRTKAMVERVDAEKEKLIASFTHTAYADPRELTEYHIGACRFCYGRMNRYQYTAGEWDQRITDHEAKCDTLRERGVDDAKMPKAPDAKGGTGYDWRKEPNPDCPECFGHGKGRDIIKDTRNLSPAALALFAGVERGKDGIKIKMHDQMRARDTLAKYRKVYEDVTEVNVNITSTKELDEIYEAGVKDTMAGKERVAGRGERLRAGARAKDAGG